MGLGFPYRLRPFAPLSAAPRAAAVVADAVTCVAHRGKAGSKIGRLQDRRPIS